MERLTQFRKARTLNLIGVIHMNVIKSLALVASLFAAGAAMADSSVVNMDQIRQTQNGGSRNTQTMELGTVDAGIASSGTARVTARNVSQTQSGTGNTQTMVLGKIDKDVKSHSTTVVATNVSQLQSGNGNTQRLKVGVIE